MATLTLQELTIGQLVSIHDDPGDIGFITDIQPTTDRRGRRITIRLVEHSPRRRTIRWLVWPDEYATFHTHRPEDYGITAPTS